MPKWKIFAGMGGGFGGATEVCDDFIGTKEEADTYAYDMAISEYESYEGMHGIRTIEEIKEEDNLDNVDAADKYNDERESWMDYYTEEIK